jgi:solute carrier family 6 amino acid transporter-like protein 5/7/9/14
MKDLNENQWSFKSSLSIDKQLEDSTSTSRTTSLNLSTTEEEAENSTQVSDFELELKQNDEFRKSLERHITIIEDPTTRNETEARDEWDNKCSFFLSALGFAVGLGNVWRFPYIAYKNGGGTFLIPYFIILFVVGLPLFFMEFVIGQYMKSGPVKLFSNIAPIFSGIGYMMIALSSIIGVYYNVIMGWSIYYLFSGFTSQLPWANCTKMVNIEGVDKTCEEMGPSEYFFNAVMQRKNEYEHSLSNLGAFHWDLAGCLAVAWLLVCLALIKGVKSSGKVVYFTALYPYVILVILFGIGLSLDGSVEGIKYYLTPDWEKIQNPTVWKEAATQIFFSFCLASGGLINMASYNKLKNNCHSDALIIGFLNCFTSVFAGFVVFAFLGFMAHEKFGEVNEETMKNVAKAGPGLAFVAYPEGIAKSPISPPLISFLFFSMLLMLGLDSMLGTIETITSAIVDHFTHLRSKLWAVVIGTCTVGFLFGLTLCTSGGIDVLGLLDSCTGGGWLLLLLAILEVVLVSWIYGIDKIFEHIEEMEIKIPTFMKCYWRVCWKYLTPGVMLLLLTQMDKSIPFLVALFIVGFLIISLDVFPSQWNKLNNNKIFGGHLIKVIKGLALSLIGWALCLRVNQNMSEITNHKDEAYFERNKFAKSFEVTLNLILVAIFPAVGFWVAYQRDPKILQPTSEWGNASIEKSLEASQSKKLSEQGSYGVTSNKLYQVTY